MAKLILTTADAGKTIPLGAGLSYQVTGTNDVDTFNVAAGGAAGVDTVINTLGGNDKIVFAGTAADYTAKKSGSSVVFTHKDGSTVSIPASSTGDTITFADGSTTTLSVGASGVVLAGTTTQVLTTTATAITGVITATPTYTYTITPAATSVTEGSALTFTVTASAAVTAATMLNYQIVGVAVAGGTATPASDLGQVTGSVTIPAGATSATFTLTPTNDGVTEGYEGFKINVLNSDFATVATSKDVAIVDGVSAGQIFTLTTSIDNLTGTAGNDTFNASSVDANGVGSTVNPGDNISGGTGTDTVVIAASGSTTLTNVQAVTLTGVEKVLVSEYNTKGGGNSVLDLSLANSDLTTVGLFSSDNSGTLEITGLKKVVDAEMKNGSNNLTLTFAAGNTGTTDALTLAVSGQTAGIFTADGIETMTVNSTLVKSSVTLAGSTLAKVNVTGDTEVAVVVPSSAYDIDASAATGKVTIDTGAVTLANITSAKGGAGTTDVIKIDEAVTASSKLSKISGFEVLAISDAVTVNLDAALVGVSTIDMTKTDGAATTLTLASGYTGATTVKLAGGTGSDVINNNANVDLIVTGTVVDAGRVAIASGTGTVDTLNLTADGAGATVLAGITGFEKINILANTTTASTSTGAIVMNEANVAVGKTMTVDASALTNTSAALNIDASAENNGKYVIIGGAGNDSIKGGNVGDTLSGGAGNDSITAGTGNDSIDGGAGNDTIVMGGNLGATDTINGGDGIDTLTVSALTSSAGFANVTNIENIGITGTVSASLSSTIGASTTFDLTDTSAQSLTFNTGYTGATTVKLGGTGVDSVVNNANVELTVTASSASFANTATITGGTGNDTITLTADASSVSLSGVSNVETITVAANTTTATNGLTLTTTASTVAATKTMAINGSALGSGAVLTVNGAATAGKLNITGGAGNDVLTGGDAGSTISGGAGNDAITGSDVASINDSISGGDGNDTITMNSGSGTLDFNDTIDGGAGTDTLVVGASISGMLAKVTNVEVLQLGATGDYAFGSDAVGFNTFDMTAAVNAQTLTLNAGFSGATTVKVNASTTSTTDIVTNTANVELTVSGDAAAFANAKNRIVGGTGNDKLLITADGNTITMDAANSSIDAITMVANTTTPTNGASITLGAGQAVKTGGTMVVDASALTNSSAVFTFNADGNTGTGTFSITGGVANDILTGDANADTIVGGAGDDSINGGTGLDILTGGAGNDTFVVNKNANGLTFASIQDIGQGDKLVFTMGAQASAVMPAKMTLAAGPTTLSDYLNAAAAGTAVGALNWFQFGGNTYVVADNNVGTTFVASDDSIIELKGLVDLSTSLIAPGSTSLHLTVGSSVSSAPVTLPAASFNLTAAATDSLVGGAGADTFSATAATGNFTNGDTVAGGLGTDTISLANSDTIVDSAWTKVTGVEVLNAGTSGNVTVGPLAQAAGLLAVVSGGTALTLNASGMTTGLTVNTAINGGTLTFTAGTGNDKIEGGAGVETLTFGANLTSADTIAGAGGTDILKVSGTVADAAFTNVTAVETLDLTAAATVTLDTLSQAAGIVTLTNSGNGATTITASARTTALNVTGGTAADSITSGSGADTIATGGGADTVIGGGAADSITGGAGVDIIKWTATTAAALATEAGTNAGAASNSGVGIGDSISTWTSGTDKLHFAAALVTNAIGTETDTLLAIAKGGTVTNVARFVHITDTAIGDNVNTHAGAVTVLNGLTSTAVAIGDSFIAAMDNDTNTYLYLVKQVSAADTIAAQDVTLIGVVNGITTVANGDFVSF